MAKNEKKTPGAAIDEMVAAVGGSVVRIETVDGVHRDGKLTGIGTRAMVINGREVLWPVDLELNGDPGDRIRVDQIRELKYG